MSNEYTLTIKVEAREQIGVAAVFNTDNSCWFRILEKLKRKHDKRQF